MKDSVIGISGLIGAGKSTAGNEVLEICKELGLNGMVRPMAYPLKLRASLLGWDGEKNENGRKFLQWLGTDVGRTYCGESYWTDKLIAYHDFRQIAMEVPMLNVDYTWVYKAFIDPLARLEKQQTASILLDIDKHCFLQSQGKSYDVLIVDDIRFVNEIYTLAMIARYENCHFLHITSDREIRDDDHSSEKMGYDQIPMEDEKHLVENNGTKEELRKEIKKCLNI